MALQVWLPLTKDLSNQGLEGKTVTNTDAVYSATGGKLGGCYTFTTSRLDIGWTVSSSLVRSYGGWFKFTLTPASGSYYYMISLGGGSGYGNLQFCICAEPTQLVILTGGTTSITKTMTYDTNWHFIFVTCDGTTTTLYYDNETPITGTGKGTALSKAHLVIGCRQGGTGIHYFKGSINDIRIYNHCLSIDEVKEIAKAKVLHIPGNEELLNYYNLPTIEYDNATWACVFVHNNPASSGVFSTLNEASYTGAYGDDKYSRLKLLITSNFKSVSGSTHEFLAVLKAESTTADESYCRWKQTTGPASTTPGSNSVSSSSVGYTNVSNSTYGLCRRTNYSYLTGTGQSSSWWGAFGSIAVYLGGIPGLGVAIKTGYLKLYVRIDNIYSRAKIHDISGYYNDFNIFSNSATNPETKRYDKSIMIQTDKYLKSASPNPLRIPHITLSIWIKPTALSGSYLTLFNSWETGGGGLYINSANKPALLLYASGYKDAIGTTVLENDKWYHLVGTYDLNNFKMYVNGECEATTACTNALTYNTNAPWAIGFNPTSSGSNGGLTYTGLVSDIRMYATALSATDIQELYKLGH